MKKFALLAITALVAASCNVFAKEKTPPPRVNVVPILRRNIEVYADASGNIEALNITEVKSKASGQVIRLNAETGVFYNAGDTLVQVDTKEVDIAVDLAKFDTLQQRLRYDNEVVERTRQDSLFKLRYITQKEYDAGKLNVAVAETNLQKSRNALEQARIRQQDATVLAPISGTVITRAVQLGQIVQSSTSGLNAGTTLLTMTDLKQLRVRASFNEVDIASIDTGMTAMISVDALADEQIPGKIAKIEPMAQTVQSVTMFPVIITIDNTDGRLRPGMNGAIQVWVERRENVVSVPNEAIRQTQETPFLSQLLSSLTGTHVDPDSLKEVVDDQIARLGRRTFPTGDNGGNNGAPNNAAPSPSPAGDAPRAPGGGGNGDVSADVPEFQAPQGRGTGRGNTQRGGGGRQGGGRGMPTETECYPVTQAIGKNPANKKAFDALVEQMKAGVVERSKTNAELRALYSKAGADTNLARRCQSRVPGLGPTAGGGPGGRGGGQNAFAGRGGGGGGGGGNLPAGFGFANRNRNTPTRNALVFVVPESGKYEARVIRTGLGSYEYTEVVEGLQEGEQVAILSAAIIALQQKQNQDKMRQNLSNPFGAGGMGGGGGNTPRGPGGGNPGGGGPGGRGGGGGGGGGGRGGG